MCNRLQMGATGASRPRKDNSSIKAIGFNQHDILITGDISMTLLGKQEDGHSVPVVFTMKIRCGKPGGGQGSFDTERNVRNAQLQ